MFCMPLASWGPLDLKLSKHIGFKATFEPDIGNMRMRIENLVSLLKTSRPSELLNVKWFENIDIDSKGFISATGTRG